MNLGIATICPHIYYAQRWWSYEPFVLEMNIWHDLFAQLVLAAPVEAGPPPAHWTPYAHSDTIRVVPYRQDKGRGLDQPPTAPGEIPAMIGALIKVARQTDAFHVRSPGSIGLLASLLIPLLQKKRCAKWAGQWLPYPGEAASVRVQRQILRSRWWGAPVTVYGQWPGQPAHIVPFFTSVLTQAQIRRAAASRGPRPADTPLRIVYVGRLSAAKNVDVLLAALAQLAGPARAFECVIIGDGPQRAALEQQVMELNLAAGVTFTGGLAFAQVLDQYEQADVLVLASETEGWPKAIAEGMAFGLICIGSDRGLIPQMLGDGRGIVVPPRDVAALVQALAPIVAAPAAYQGLRDRAAAWAQAYSLDGLRDALQALLIRSWHLAPETFAPGARREPGEAAR